MRARDVMRRKRFREWLQKKFAQSPMTTVGYPNDYTANPLTIYVSDSGYQHAMVGRVLWRPYLNPEKSLWLPKWACDFISAVNSSGLKRITAQRAIKLLEAA